METNRAMAVVWQRCEIKSPMIVRCRLLQATLVLMLTASAGAAPIDGKDIATNGNGRGAHACASCHGASGEGRPDAGYPRLAGLGTDYLIRQLADFDAGDRSNSLMHPISKALTADERSALATYYSRLTAPRVATFVGSPANQLKAGEVLAQRGDWAHGLPACSQCHGASGQGVAPNFPRLAAQSAGYLQRQLQAWKQGNRTGDPMNLMTGIASKLDDNQIAAVAAYYASLPAESVQNKDGP